MKPVRPHDAGQRRVAMRQTIRAISITSALWLLPAAPVACAAILRVGPDKPFRTVRAAAQSVQDGDTVEIDSGIYRQDVATWRSGNVTVRGVGAMRPHLIADGVNESGKDATFLQLRPGTTARIINNIFLGPGTPWTKDGITLTSDHNYIEPSGNNSPRLADPLHFDYHLQPDSPCRDAGVSPGSASGYDLTPQSEYAADAQCRRRPAVGAIAIGAFEYQAAFADRTFFPRLVVGGGYSTVFTISNVGAAAAAGELILTDESGGVLPVALFDVTSVQEGVTRQPDSLSASYGLSIPADGTSIIVAGAKAAGDPARSGWARIESSGGIIWGSATFRLEKDGAVRATAGVFGSQPVESAIIPVDNDDSQSRYVGFAVANPNGNDINITLATLDEEGRLLEAVSPAELNPLGVKMQKARFLHEYLDGRSKFRGSMVLWEKSGQKFTVVALVQNQGLYTAIPVIPGKPPTLPAN